MENVSEVFLSQDCNRDIAHVLMLIQRKGTSSKYF